MRDRVIDLESELRELASMIKPEPASWRNSLQQLLEEARDNHRLITGAFERKRYWKLTEDAPATKRWKKHRKIIAADPSTRRYTSRDG